MELLAKLESISVLRSILSNEVITSLIDLLSCDKNDTVKLSSTYSEFVFKLYAAGYDNITYLIRDLVNDSENPYIISVFSDEHPSTVMENSLKHDLSALQKIALLTPNYFGFDASWTVDETVDLLSEYMERIKNIHKYGYGIYARNRMFIVDEIGEIKPVKHPDTITIAELAEYESERNRIIDNTRAFLEGKPASDILLTGDAGTGKSTTIKAVANEFYPEGLRIVELRKEQLSLLPKIVDKLSFNPLKFILFIDDLSFLKADDDFNALKAMLEGSVSSYSTNVKVYVTSNRRHLIKENFSDRDGDDIHRNDTMQELNSLSERFGVHISFSKPDKVKYLNIVRHYMKIRGIEYDNDQLEVKAESFAMRKTSRSARAARQFADNVESGMITVK